MAPEPDRITMATVLIVIHLMVVVALIAMVLLQRSEGGALGIGGGGGFLTSRGSGNVLTRSTAILAAAFFATSIGLTLLARYNERPASILDRVPASSSAPVQPGVPGEGGAGGGILDQLPGQQPPAAPVAPGVPGSQ